MMDVQNVKKTIMLKTESASKILVKVLMDVFSALIPKYAMLAISIAAL